jgi:hypothetical protein
MPTPKSSPEHTITESESGACRLKHVSDLTVEVQTGIPTLLLRGRPCTVNFRVGSAWRHGIGNGDLLFIINREQQIVPKIVAAVAAPASPIVKNFGRLRQPKVEATTSELHGSMELRSHRYKSAAVAACAPKELTGGASFRIVVLLYEVDRASNPLNEGDLILKPH